RAPQSNVNDNACCRRGAHRAGGQTAQHTLNLVHTMGRKFTNINNTGLDAQRIWRHPTHSLT
ncbi:hypothetical protein N9Y68_08145, partial [Luminiphilus sp.]|nr:hypothetical protein [Luminiphilus sp.]